MNNRLAEWIVALNVLLSSLAERPLTREELLDSLAQFCVDQFDAAFARIWLADADGKVLVLKSSRGQYTQLNGTRSRIVVGQGSKIDKMYTEQNAHITNNVLTDPGVKDKEWAAREGLVSFAGYPLTWGGERLGVLGMYSRQILSEDLILVMGIFAMLVSAIVALREQVDDMMALAETMGLRRSLMDRLVRVSRGPDKQ